MAYFAGNAVYIAHTKNRVKDFEDYRNMCGAGVTVADNTFEGNIGFKNHNGGAYIHHCIQYESDTEGFSKYNHTSSLPLAHRSKAEDDTGGFEFYYEDP